MHIQDLEKIPVITSEIRRMMLAHPKVYLENEKPRCHVTQVGPSSLNIAVTCNLKPMVIASQIVAVLSNFVDELLTAIIIWLPSTELRM